MGGSAGILPALRRCALPADLGAGPKGAGVEGTALVAQGDAVQAGQLLLQVDLAMIQDKVPSTISPIVFTNLPEGVGVTVEEGRTVKAGETGFFSVK